MDPLNVIKNNYKRKVVYFKQNKMFKSNYSNKIQNTDSFVNPKYKSKI